MGEACVLETRRRQRIPTLVKAALFCFALYAAITLIHLQLEINKKTSRIQELDEAIQSQISANEDLQEQLDKGASDDQIAAIARDKLGYGYPQERRFVDASSK